MQSAIATELQVCVLYINSKQKVFNNLEVLQLALGMSSSSTIIHNSDGSRWDSEGSTKLPTLTICMDYLVFQQGSLPWNTTACNPISDLIFCATYASFFLQRPQCSNSVKGLPHISSLLQPIFKTLTKTTTNALKI